MTREEIDAMCIEAVRDADRDGVPHIRYHFAARVAAAEREACARIVEPSADHRRNPEWYIGGEEAVELLIELAAAIRARGEKP